MVGFSVIFCVEVDLRIIVDRLIFDISVFYVQLRTTVLFQVEIEKPGNVKDQKATYSMYKSANTLKTMIGISPRGRVTYVSPSYGGATSDRQIIERSSLLKDRMIECLLQATP